MLAGFWPRQFVGCEPGPDPIDDSLEGNAALFVELPVRFLIETRIFLRRAIKLAGFDCRGTR